MRGIAIAEGDILGLAIREYRSCTHADSKADAVPIHAGLVNEILIGRYDMPAPTDPNSLLARHEAGLLDELREVVQNLAHHRSDDVNRLILPYCQPAMEAIGHRMAYDAAVAAGVRPCLIDLYVANVVKLDPAWYAEHAGLGRKAQQEMETRAQDQVLPLLGKLVKEMDVFPYVTAPIISDDRWAAFVQDLKVFRGNAHVDLLKQRRGQFGIETEMVRSHL